MSETQYSMFGKDDDGTPTVAANVTTVQARKIASAKSLNGMILAPQVPGTAGHLAYIRNDEGEYKVVRMHEWLTGNLTSCTGEEVLERPTNP